GRYDPCRKAGSVVVSVCREGSVTGTEQDGDSAVGIVGHGQIEQAIAIEIADRKRDGFYASGIVGFGLKGSIAVTLQHGHCAVLLIGYQDVELAIVVHVSRENAGGVVSCAILVTHSEAAVPVARHDQHHVDVGQQDDEILVTVAVNVGNGD